MYYISYLCFRNAANQCGPCLNKYLRTWKELRHVNTQEVLRDWVVDGVFVWTHLSRWKNPSNITATYESRLKCKKTIAYFPHSPTESFHELFKVCSAAISAVIWSDTTLPIFPEWLVTLIHLQDWLTSPHTNQKWHLLKYQRPALLNDLYLNHGQIARLSELQVLPRLYSAPVFDVC